MSNIASVSVEQQKGQIGILCVGLVRRSQKVGVQLLAVWCGDHILGVIGYAVVGEVGRLGNFSARPRRNVARVNDLTGFCQLTDASKRTMVSYFCFQYSKPLSDAAMAEVAAMGMRK